MLRLLDFVFIAGVLLIAAAVYDLKNLSEDAAERVASLSAAIETEQNRIRLLRAEWSVLNQPARLQALVERYNEHLGLATLEARQIAPIESLPTRRFEADPIGADPVFGGYADSNLAGHGQ